MTEKRFEAKLREVSQVKFPLVKAAFQGKDGKVYIGMMLIDTGSVDCILNKSVLRLIDESAVRSGDEKRIYSVQSNGCTCQGVDFTFRMGNDEFSDVFYVNDTIDFNHMFESFIGIVGHSFLRKHKLALDYLSETLHTSDGCCGDPADYEFFFPMEFGISQYNIPIVGILNDDKEYLLIADSGANDNVITRHMVEEAGISLEETNESGSVIGFNNKEIGTSILKAKLCLLSIGGTIEEPKICSYIDKVQVIGQHQYLIDGLKDPNGNDLPSISGLLSSAFMQEHKWILDFGIGIMYSKKTT